MAQPVHQIHPSPALEGIRHPSVIKTQQVRAHRRQIAKMHVALGFETDCAPANTEQAEGSGRVATTFCADTWAARSVSLIQGTKTPANSDPRKPNQDYPAARGVFGGVCLKKAVAKKEIGHYRSVHKSKAGLASVEHHSSSVRTAQGTGACNESARTTVWQS